MEDVQAAVERLRQRRDQAYKVRAQAEYARQQAEQAASDLVASLKSEFGVETPDEARALLADLDRQVATEVARIEEALGS